MFQVGDRFTSTFNNRSYVFTQELGEGGTATVFAAEAEDGYVSAIKVIRPSAGLDEEFLLREARLWAALPQHPNIVTLDEIHSSEHGPLLVLEYIGGGTLHDEIVRAGGPLPHARVIEVGAMLCTGMSFIHTQTGIVHRDLKPLNCMLDQKFSIKITDFGIASGATVVHREGQLTQTTVTQQRGTLPYMAPEQYEETSLDQRTDIYAIGVTLIQLLTTALPMPTERVWAEDVLFATKDAIGRPELVEILAKCVANRRRDRWRVFDELHDALDQLRPAGQAKRKRPDAAIEHTADDLIRRARHILSINYMNTAAPEFESACADALQMFLEARRLGNDAGWLCCDIANVYRKLQDYPNAIEWYGKALAASPQDATILGNVAQCMREVGQPEPAIQMFQRALKLAPQNIALLANYAGALNEAGNPNEARRQLEFANQLAPDNPIIQRDLKYLRSL